jgi:orotate phosphoribosyltransferase
VSGDALAGDLSRGGYLRGAFAFEGGASARWFRTDLVLTRPGVLERCADRLIEALPADVDRLAARGPAAVALATALALRTGVQLLLGEDGPGDFGGDVFPDARIVLVEDVLLTGAHAVASIGALREAGLDVRGVVAVVDRLAGARYAIEELGVPLVSLFAEDGLLA